MPDFISASMADYASARSIVNANCQGCSGNGPGSRVKVGEKGYVPIQEKIDAGLKTEAEAIFFERTLCLATQSSQGALASRS